MATKKKKMPFLLRFIRTAFPILEMVAPPVAHRWAVKLFVHPIRFPWPEREKGLLESAHRFDVPWSGGIVQGYRWGSGKPAIVMHGWGGRATQLFVVINHLVEAGYEVYAFDAPAHGHSAGKKTNIMEFENAMQNLAKTLSEPPVYVGHSLGGAVALLGRSNGLELERLVTIGTPTVAKDIIDEFLKRINASQKVAQYFYDYVYSTFGVTFTSVSAVETARKSAPIPTLVIHDRNDRESPYAGAEALLDELPHAEHFATEGLGHTRILRDEAVAKRIVTFFEGEPVKQAKPEQEFAAAG